MKTFIFPCGCSWPVLEESSDPDTMPLLDFDVDNAPEDCPATWRMLGEGKSKGVFQLETPLGRQWCKKLKPEHGEHMSALGAILRPGCVSGDTKVRVAISSRKGRNIHCRQISIRDLYHKFQFNHCNYEKQVVSLNEYDLRLFNNVIEDVTSSGIKKVYRPIFKVGARRVCSTANEGFYQLECTDDHKLLTHDRGWVELREIHAGERVAVVRATTLRQARARCELRNFSHIRWVEYDGKELIGEKDTYDISVAGPHHSFVAGNVIVHNCLKAYDEEGVSATQHYCRRKNKEEDTVGYHPAVDPILFPTYNVMVYQEQAMAIARAVAGFDLQQADVLRKCVTGDTKFVSKSRGWISIDRLLSEGYENDVFLIMDERGNQFWKPIEKIWSTGNKDVNRVTGASGMGVWATHNHQFLTADGWKTRMSLSRNDFLIAARHVMYNGKDSISRDEAIVIAADITGLGLSTKCLPDIMMGMTLETTRAFLSVLLEVGRVDEENRQFRLSSNSQVLVEQIQLLLLRFGVRSHVTDELTPGFGMAHNLCVNDIEDKKALVCELSYSWPSQKQCSLRNTINYKDTIFNDDEPKLAFIFDRLETVKPRKESQPVYDFTVAGGDTPFIVANGLVIHNSIGKKLPEEMAKVKKMFVEGAEKAGVVTTHQAEELFGWIEKSQRYSFNHCVSWDTVIRRATSKQYYDVAEMYRIRNDISYAKASGRERLRHFWEKLGSYGYGLSMCKDGRIRPNIIRDIKPSGIRVVYRVTLKDGQWIDVTDNHKFPTTLGIMTLAEIIESQQPGQKSVQLYVCGEFVKTVGYPSIISDIFSIDVVGPTETYDVTMDGPNHNFVTGTDIVTCNSHALSYGLTGYDTAYIKAHFPLAFFTAWLYHAKDKPDPLQEVFELVNDAKQFDIDVEPPDFRSLETHFHTDRKVVRFGLSDIKGVGEIQVAKMEAALTTATSALNNRSPVEWTWLEFMLFCSPHLAKSIVSRLIEVGALRWFNMSRQKMLAEYNAWCDLTDMEQKWITEAFRVCRGDFVREELETQHSFLEESFSRLKEEHCQSQDGLAEEMGVCKEKIDTITMRLKLMNQTIPPIKQLLDVLGWAARTRKEGGAAHNQKRASIMQGHASLLLNPPRPLNDSPVWIAWIEEELLGIPITCSKIDSCDTSQVNTTCKDYLGGQSGFLIFGVEIQSAREVTTKRGKTPGSKMAFLTLSDGTCCLENVVCFPETWREYGELLVQGNTVILQGERDQKKDSDTLIVKKVWQANQTG